MRNKISDQGFVSDLQDEPFSLTVEGDVTVQGTVGVSGSACTQFLHVDVSGSDTSGDGSYNKPYQTIAKAISVVSAAGDTTGLGLKILKSAGTTARSLLVDYVQGMVNWVSPNR